MGCLAAVQKAAHKRGYSGTESISLKVSDRALVPPGCSYSINSKSALFNEHTGSWQKSGNYRTVCLATSRPHRVILLSRGRGGSTVLATTLAAFGHSDPEKLHHELFGSNEKEMVKLQNPTETMQDWFREMEQEQPTAGVVGFKWKPYVMGTSTYGSAWDWVAEHNVSVVWMTRNILDVLISNHKHCGDDKHCEDDKRMTAHCHSGDEECIAERRVGAFRGKVRDQPLEVHECQGHQLHKGDVRASLCRRRGLLGGGDYESHELVCAKSVGLDRF